MTGQPVCWVCGGIINSSERLPMEMRIMKKKVLVVLSLSFLMHTLLNDKEE
jgi:hypothetical protein